MTPQTQQQNIHSPLKGQYGDCVRACIASALDLPIAVVPNFAADLRRWDARSRLEGLERVRAFLAPERNLWTVVLLADEKGEILSLIGKANSNQRYFLAGGTPYKHINHMVCCRGTEIEWNPSPTAEIVQPLWPDRSAFTVSVITERI